MDEFVSCRLHWLPSALFTSWSTITKLFFLLHAALPLIRHSFGVISLALVSRRSTIETLGSKVIARAASKIELNKFASCMESSCACTGA